MPSGVSCRGAVGLKTKLPGFPCRPLENLAIKDKKEVVTWLLEVELISSLLPSSSSLLSGFLDPLIPYRGVAYKGIDHSG